MKGKKLDFCAHSTKIFIGLKTRVSLPQHQGTRMCDQPSSHQVTSVMQQDQQEPQMQSPEIKNKKLYRYTEISMVEIHQSTIYIPVYHHWTPNGWFRIWQTAQMHCGLQSLQTANFGHCRYNGAHEKMHLWTLTLEATLIIYLHKDFFTVVLFDCRHELFK